jgi:enoyl-CoA hydratase/carnithine racemase
VNGAAVGAGATTLLPMDIRLASTSARFGFVFARRGVTPEAASSWFLPRLVGISTALEWCYSGRLVEAEEARSRGLVRSVHEPDDLLPAALALGREFASNAAPVSMALTRRMMWRMLGASHPMEAHRADTRAIRSRAASQDAKEGVASFLERRLPQFPDRISHGLPDVFTDWQEPEFH